MNNETPRTLREELEARVIALLCGDLDETEATDLERIRARVRRTFTAGRRTVPLAGRLPGPHGGGHGGRS